MTKLNLHKQAIRYIQNQSGADVFTVDDGLITIDRTLPTQRKIQLQEIKETINTFFTASDGYEVPVRIYIPQRSAGKHPLIIYYHGGGWAIGDLDYMDGGCQYLTKHSHAIVVSIDYRLAPENPYPTPQNDAYEGFLWAYANSLNLPIDLSKIAVAGDSAGGNLAASVAVRAVVENAPKIHKQLLIYPALDASKIYNSYIEFGEELGLDADEMLKYYTYYIQDQEVKKHPYISPLLFQHKQLLPETIIVAAEYDVLNDEGIEFIAELNKAGVHAEHYILPGLIHSFFSKMDYFEEETSVATSLLATFFNS